MTEARRTSLNALKAAMWTAEGALRRALHAHHRAELHRLNTRVNLADAGGLRVLYPGDGQVVKRHRAAQKHWRRAATRAPVDVEGPRAAYEAAAARFYDELAEAEAEQQEASLRVLQELQGGAA